MATTIGIEPLADRVVVLPVEKNEEISASGIIISNAADTKEKPVKGTVVAVGPGRIDDGVLVAPTVSLGDTVLFSKYGYDEVKVDGKEYVILSESNILAVIK